MVATDVALLDNLPNNLKPPDGLVLKPSTIATNDIGVWCSERFDVGKRFGPFLGEIIEQYESNHSPDNYAWEVLDLKTHEFLHYVDSSDLSKSNWMRFVRCANYFEEQNIVSEQHGTDIYYKVIKTISPNEELLTWYDMSQFKKSVRARSRQRKPGRKPKTKLKLLLTDPAEETTTDKVSYTKDTETPGTEKMMEGGDTDRNPRCRRKPSILDNYICDGETLSEMDKRKNRMSSNNSPDIHTIDPVSPNLDATGTKCITKSLATVDERMDTTRLDKEYFRFVMTSEHLIQNGSHFLFKCNVCHATYRQAFSLKRHFLRRHVNYTYITNHDRQNCGLNGRRYLELQAKVNSLTSPIQAESKNGASSPDHKSNRRTTPKTTNEGHTLIGEIKTEKCEKGSEVIIDRVRSSSEGISTSSQVKANIKIETDATGDSLDDEVYRPVVSPISLPDTSATNHEPSTYNTSRTPNDIISVAKNVNDHKVETLENNSILDAFFESQLAELNKKLAELDAKQEALFDKDYTNYDQPILHRSLNVFWCEHCNHLYPSLSDLKEHYKKSHQLAGKSMEKDEYDDHVKNHDGVVDLTCRRCGKIFKTLGRFRKHENEVQCFGRVRCRLCPADFANRENFLYHCRRFHADGNNTHMVTSSESKVDISCKSTGFLKKDCNLDRDDRDVSMKLANQAHGFRFACTICKKRFREYHYMCRHRRLAHEAPKRRLGHKNKSKEVVNDDVPSDPSDFYTNVANNIAENLSFFIDGKRDSLENHKNQVKSDFDSPSNEIIVPDWCSMNFHSSFDPASLLTCVPQIAVDLSVKTDCDSPVKIARTDIIQTRTQSEFSSMPTEERVPVQSPNHRANNTFSDDLEDHYDPPDTESASSVSPHPTSQGILGNVVTPRVMHSQRYHCTKCEQQFDNTDSLHSHIITCGPLPVHGIQNNKQVRKHSLLRKFRTYRVFKDRHVRGTPVNGETAEIRYESLDPEVQPAVDMEPAMRRTTRSSYYHKYDPRRHVRRRDTRPILDTEQCRACLKRFKTILKLERHARVCSEKQYFISASRQQQHASMKCIYCLKQFTYKLSLKRHLIEVCKVKKHMLENNLLDDGKIEEEVILLNQLEMNLPLVPVRGKVDEFSKKKKKRKRARLGLKPSVKKVLDNSSRDGQEMNQSSNGEPMVNESSIENDTRKENDNKLTEAGIHSIGKRSRKMTVKALESVSLQMALDFINATEKTTCHRTSRKPRSSIKQKRLNKSMIENCLDSEVQIEPPQGKAEVQSSENERKRSSDSQVHNAPTEDRATMLSEVLNGDEKSKNENDKLQVLRVEKKELKRKLSETDPDPNPVRHEPDNKKYSCYVGSRTSEAHEQTTLWEDPYEFRVENTIQNGLSDTNPIKYGRRDEKQTRKRSKKEKSTDCDSA